MKGARGQPDGLSVPRFMSPVLILFLLMTLLAVPAMAKPDAGPAPTMSISLEPTQQEAEITSRDNGTVELQGTVEIDQPRVMTSVLTLDCVANTGWPVDIDPNGTEVTGPMTIHFTTTVVIPAGTSSLLTANVIISGSLKAPGLAPVVASASAVVTVKQYFKLRISTSYMAHVQRGESDNIEVAITNDGNGMDTVNIELLGVPDGIRVSLSTNQVTIHQNEHVTIELEVTANKDSPAGSHDMVIMATSGGSGGEYHQSETVIAYVDTPFDGAPGLSISIVILAIIVVSVIAQHRKKR